MGLHNRSGTLEGGVGDEKRVPTRVVHHADAIAWLRAREPSAGCAMITSVPDVSEVGLSVPQWRTWFFDAVRACVRAIPDDQPLLFFQTDIKKSGVWVDKSTMVQEALAAEGAALLFHKIVLRKPAGTHAAGRPAYTHLLAASRALRPPEPSGLPDVIDDAGEQVWVRAMGMRACAAAVGYVRKHASADTILDPFCGHGTVLAVANAFGFHAIGVELNRKRAALSRALALPLDAADLG
jgi:hypothetical protein